MKPFFLFIALSLSSFFASAQSFNKLWKIEQQQEEDGKPKSAYATVQKILRKAESKGHRGQALSARMRAAALHQAWAPDSFFTDIAEIEALRRSETSPEARAIYASILAEIYENNRQRSQAHDLELTSGEMKEWTREQYDSAAMINWRLSLEEIPVLGQARSKDWLPFVVQNASSAYFHHDLLHILWQRAMAQCQSVWSEQSRPVEVARKQIEEYYRSQGNREATLLMVLDGRPKLSELKEEYADLPLSIEIYLRLLETNASDSQKVVWAEEAIQRYPNYERTGEVRNHLNELRHPSVKWTGNEVYYPGKNYQWVLTAKNATSVTIEIFRLQDDFTERTIKQSKLSASEYFHRHATLIQTLTPTLPQAPVFKTVKDTIRWTAPEAGCYAILYQGTTDESEAIQQSVSNQYQIFRVTALKTMQRTLPDGSYEVIVVDAETGHPVKDAEVTLFQKDYRNDSTTVLGTKHSDTEGRARFSGLQSKQKQLYIQVKKDTDCWLPSCYVYRETPTLPYAQGGLTVKLYTDRAIYRPGQTVHVGGIAYQEDHWDASPTKQHTFELILHDANRKEVGRETVKTDEWGVFATDFVLPEGRLPGNYHIVTGKTRVYFRVEEYKRPTFEVTMDEAPALQWPQDSITLTGKAMGYNGVPVRDGRVTGTYQFTYPYFWWYRHDDSPRNPIDTIQTDDTGIFRVRVPLKSIPSDALRYGLILQLNVEVLSPVGETREGSTHVPLCTTPLRLSISMNEKQDRDRLTSPVFSLLSSTGQPVQGEIRCAFIPAGQKKPAVADVLPADVAKTLRLLPSGEYTLRAFARVGQDSASDSVKFYLFSLADTRLPRYTDCWLYCPSDSFDLEHPARLQVGSSFPDVALYYSLTGPKGIVKDEIISLSEELRLLEIPYKEEYGDGLTATFAFVKHGEHYQQTQQLRRTLPDRQLRWKWTTFRNRLHPGDKETWTLKLTTPDGKPADAHLMAVIYDASLDQLTPHSWSLALRRYHRLLTCDWESRNFFSDHAYFSLLFPMKEYSVESLDFDAFDGQWMDGLSFRVGRVYGTRSLMRASRVSEDYALAPLPMLEKTVTNDVAYIEAESEESAALSADDAKRQQGEDAATVGVADANLRTNFNETAAFLPRLHSNPKTGEVTLSFTLPESLTTWQLLGVAHTTDFLTTNLQAQAVARKELMARLYLPRFLRADDVSSIRAAIQNLTEKTLSGKAKLEIFDPETEKLILRKSVPFTAKANGETILSFDYTPTEDYPLVAVRLTAETTPAKKRGTTFSDGEQHYLPILPSKEWLTESIELQADSAGVFTTDLSSLFNKDNPSATHRRLTVEYTTHPIWNVVQALPAMREPQSDDVLSLTSHFYADALSAHIAAVTPRLREVIALWKRQAAATSPLAEDETIKQIILQETPWLREADDDVSRRAQLIDLFDESLVENRLTSVLDRLSQRQLSDGGFSWFPGMYPSELMTRLVCIELTRLRTLTDNFAALPSYVKTTTNRLLQRGFDYLAEKTAKEVQAMKKREKEGGSVHTGYLMYLHYIYITQRAGVSLSKSQKDDVRYLFEHMKGSVASMSNDERAVAALVLKADGRQKDAQGYYDSMLEHLTATQHHGTYFDYAGGSFTPTGNKIIVHTTAMEAVTDFETGKRGEPSTSQLMRGMRRWLLQQKRTQMWESSICTADAIYALLRGAAAVEDLQSTAEDHLVLNYLRKKVEVKQTTAQTSKVAGAEKTPASLAALGYLRVTYTDGAAPSSLTVQRNSSSEAWGAVYAQYLTPVADASAHATGLSVRREMSTAAPHLGDKVITRYVITADRDYEYVCLRAERAACTEPAEQLSGYNYQGGLGYYRAVRDAHTDYFFDHLPKGTYLLEESAFVDRTGRYTTGLVTLRCLYAPEYGANTPAITINIEK